MDPLEPVRPPRRRRAGRWALEHLLLPMRWYAAGWGVPVPLFDGTEQPDPQTSGPQTSDRRTPGPRSPGPQAPTVAGPPAGHPERLVPGVPPTPVERDLWERLARLS